MDRREALKRLGVGGALAVTAPLLLDSFNVAHAMSHVNEEPPDGIGILIDPPATTKSNSLTIEFNPDVFDSEGTLWFVWIPRASNPAITLEVQDQSNIAQIKKATGNGNINAFTIEVQVWEELGQDMNLVATYFVESDGGVLTVTLQS